MIAAEATAAALVRSLNLARHPEGGWYRETYRSPLTIPVAALPDSFGGERSVCTAIYFLLERGDISALHRIKSDELWHFHAGAALTIHVFTPAGECRQIGLGSNIGAGESFQAMVPAGCWFGAEISAGGDFSLVGCTVAPGFDFDDFEMAAGEQLARIYPDHGEVIRRLTR